MKNITTTNSDQYWKLLFYTVLIFGLLIPSFTVAMEFVETIKDGDGIIDGLKSPIAVATSPDNNHVYVVSKGNSWDTNDDSLVVFNRNPDTNKLTFIAVSNELTGVTGLEGAKSVTVSPDGQYVYVASDSLEDGKKGHVVVFSRDISTGKVNFIEQHELSDADSVVASHDNQHVYVASGKDNAVLVFSRIDDGKLTLLETKLDGEDGIDGLAGAKSLAIDSDGRHIYVLGYDDNALAVFKRDQNTGFLTFVESHKNAENGVDGLAEPFSLVISPDNEYIYVRGQIENEFGHKNAIAIFRQESTNDNLTFVDTLSSSEIKLDDIELDDIDLITTTDDYFYIVNNKHLSVLNRDNTGALTLLEKGDEIDGVDLAEAITVDSDGKHIYIINTNDAILNFELNATTGIPSFIETLRNGTTGIVDGLAKAVSVAISSNNKHIYVAGKDDDAIAVFNRDAIDGKLTFIDVKRVDGVDGINSVIVSPNGKHVYGASENSNALVVFSRDNVTGILSFIEMKQDGVDGIDGLAGANSVVVSPDDQYVYATAGNDNAITVFRRDTDTDKLTLVETQQNGVDGVAGIESVHSLTISTDENSLYAINKEYYEALAVFSRDINTGKLTFVEMHEQPENLTEGSGIGGATAIIVSPDNKHVYVVSATLGTMVLFERELNTGKLKFIEKKTGDDGANGLENANSIVVSADGNHAYVASGTYILDATDGALSVFRRDLDGKLYFLELKENGIGGINGLKDAKSLVITSDNNHLYVASEEDNAITVFTTERNQAPKIEFKIVQSPTTKENVPITFSGDQIVINDEDAYTHPIQVMLTPTNGTLTFNGTTCGEGTNEIICLGTVIAINTALNGMSFTPESGFSGEASLQINADDQGNTGGGEVGTDEKTLTIIVKPIIGAPSVSNAATNVGTKTTHGLVISRSAGDGSEVTHFYITNIVGGKLYLKNGTQISNGSFITFSQGDAGLKFLPNSDNNGNFDVQSATTCDNVTCPSGGIATATISVNTKPVLTEIEDKMVSVGTPVILTAAATDRENNAFRFRLNYFEGADIDPNTGVFTWIPKKSGTETFTISVTEIDSGISSSTSFTITVTTAPELDPIDNQNLIFGDKIEFYANATHREKHPLEFTLSKAPDGANIDKTTRAFTWKPDRAGTETITVRVTETKYNLSKEETFDVTVAKAKTGLRLTLDQAAIFKNGSLNVAGKLTSYPNLNHNLENLDIQLEIIFPVGERITIPTKTNSQDGRFAFKSLPAFDQVGLYEFQVAFAGNNGLLPPPFSPTEYLQVNALAGYAILIQGKFAGDEQGLEAHNKSLNRVYRRMMARGFTDDNIEYLNYNTDQAKFKVKVDKVPDRANISAAFANIRQKMNTIPGPLYIVMVGHGSVDGSFYLDDDTISPAEMNTWLNNFEAGLVNNYAKKLPRIVIVGACYSGNYIPAMSKPGRVIVTSTTNKEASYKGPKEPDEVRSGEYFIEALFAEFGKGKPLQDVFNIATDSVEILTRMGSDVPFNPYFQDWAAQHPLLDDNGDRIGSNILPTIIEGKKEAEGSKAEQIYLGIGPRFQLGSYQDNHAMIIKVTDTQSLGANASTINLSATVNDSSLVANNQVIADVRLPDVTQLPDGIEHKGQLEVNDLIRVILKPTNGNNFAGDFNQITIPGKYEVFYFVQDVATNDISPLRHSIFFKRKNAANNPPASFDLIYPPNDTEQPTAVIFEWGDSFDHDYPMTYTLMLATSQDFTNHEVYRQEELLLPMAYIDNETVINKGTPQQHIGLRDDTTYYWKVIAIDSFGEMTYSSSTFSFLTNDKNQPRNPNFGIICSDYDIQPQPKKASFYSVSKRFMQRYFPYCTYEEQSLMISTSTTSSKRTRRSIRYVTSQETYVIKPGKIQFLTNSTQIDNTQNQIEFLVERVGGDAGKLSVQYAVLGTEASDLNNNVLTWEDKDSSPQRISLDASQHQKTFTIVLLDEGRNLLGSPSQITVKIGDIGQTPADDENPGQPAVSTGPSDLTKPSGDTDTTGSVDGTSTTDSGTNIGTSTGMIDCGANLSTTVNSVPNIPVPELPSTGTLQFSRLIYTADANKDFARIIVTRKDGKFNQVSVNYIAIVDNSSLINGKLVWKHDEVNSKIFDIPINDKLSAEPKLLKLRLFAPGENTKLGIPSEAVLQIINNDIELAKGNIEPEKCEALPDDCAEPPAECPCALAKEKDKIIISLIENYPGKPEIVLNDSSSTPICHTKCASTVTEEPDKIIIGLQDNYGEKEIVINDSSGTPICHTKSDIDLPNLGNGAIFDGYGHVEYDETNVTFAGGIALAGEKYEITQTVSVFQPVSIMGKITVEPEHVDKKADIFVAAGYIPFDTDTETFYMLNTGRLAIYWDVNKPETLLPFIENLTLQATSEVEIYSGDFPGMGELGIYFGYRLKNSDDIIFNGEQAIHLIIGE